MKREPVTITEKIHSETTADLVNIHSFLTSCNEPGLSVFTLLLNLTVELMHRKDGKLYLSALSSVLNAESSPKDKAIFDKIFAVDC